MSTARHTYAGDVGTGTTIDNMKSRCKVFGVVNQSGTQALGEQFNITSVTDGGVGATTFTYAAGFVAASSQVPAGMNFSAQVVSIATRTATSLAVNSYTIASAPALIDSVVVSFAAMGTLA